MSIIYGANKNQGYRMIETICLQAELCPELPLLDDPKEYQDPSDFFFRLDQLLCLSDLDREFFKLSAVHQKIELLTDWEARILPIEGFLTTTVVGILLLS